MLRLRAWNGAYSNPSAIFARRAFSSIFGILLWGIALFLGLSLATWNVADPSFTHATSAPVQNWMGSTGAAFADPIMQMFGLAAPLILVPFALWGTRLLAGRPLGFEPGRIGAGIGALVLTPALLNAFPTTGAWPLPMGLGGVVGEAWISLVTSVVGLHSGVAQGFFGGVLGVVAGALAWHAISPVRVRAPEPQLGFQIRRSHAEDDYGLDDTDAFEDDTPRWSAALGMILHHANAVAARVRRLAGLSRPAPRPLPTPAPAPARRAMPAAPKAAAPPARIPQPAAAPAAPKLPPAPLDDEDLFAVEAAAAARPTQRPKRQRPAAPAVAAAPRPRRALPLEEAVSAAPEPAATEADEAQDDRHYVFHRPLRGPAARLQHAVAQAVADGRLEPDHEPIEDEAQLEHAIADETARIDESQPDEAWAADARDDVEYDNEPEARDEDPDIPDSLTEVPPYQAEASEALPWEDDTDAEAEWIETDDDTPDAAQTEAWADAEPDYDETDEDDFDPLADAGARYAEPVAQAPVSRPPVQPLVVPHKTAIAPGRRVVKEAQPSFLSSAEYEFPPLALLTAPPAGGLDDELTEDALEANARVLEGVLEDFGVRGSIIHVRPGPVVTLYELEPAPGIKSSRVIGLADDIARSMSAISARVAVIPGKNAIGIELPNRKRVTVFLRELLASKDFERTKAKLPMCLGKTIGGEAVIADLARMPHLLVAGTTGSGKSVSINTMILSLLYWHKPENCRVILIDPKMLELSVYDGIPHLLTPVVTDPKKAVSALKWAVREMEDRYRKMAKLGVRNIDGYNTRLKEADRNGEPLSRLVQTGFDKRTGEAIFEEEILSLDPMPYIVVIVDEMADLMIVAGKEIEGTIQRLAQMARAAGIHIIMATQRPSVDVITGTIKANFPTRISFQVTSKIDSRTVLGEMGAEQLLGMGDMLYMAGGGRIQRVHGPFVSDEEVEDVVAHLRQQGIPEYLTEVLDEVEEDAPEGGDATGLDAMSESDDLYDRAVALVLRDRKASTSYVQRRLSIGYNRAATLIERMENEGVVSPANNSGKREILVPAQEDAA